MEQVHLRDLILSLTQRLVEECFPSESSVGWVVQAYLKDAEETTLRLLRWVERRGVPITLRLVRGAYWDSEVITSRQQNWPCPVYTKKADTDACYERLLNILFQHPANARVAVATHNVHSLAYAMAKAEELRIPPERWECQMLFGISEPLQEALRQAGVPLRIYVPVGELIPGMAYLVRRLLENTSQYSFLTRAFGEPVIG